MNRKAYRMAVKRFLALFLTTSIISFYSSPFAFGAQAVVLTDSQLDQVYAGGLSQNFLDGFKFQGSPQSLVNKSSNNSTASTTNRDSFIIQTSDPRVKVVVSLSAPIAPKAPTSPHAVTNTAASSVSGANNSTNNSSVAGTNNIENNTAGAGTNNIENNAAGAGPNNIENNSAGTGPNNIENNSSGAGTNNIENNTSGEGTNNIESNTAGAGTNNIENNAAGAAEVNNAAAAPELPVDSVIDISSLRTVNSVNVQDTAQQFMSSLISVNAAGSSVGLQMNLVTLMNSTIENLHISNNLDVSVNNYTTYWFQTQ